MFIDFRVPPTTPWSMCLPLALFFLKQYTLGFDDHVFYICCDFLSISGPPGNCFQRLPICSNDYASKTLIKILCKKTCCTAPHLFLSLIYRVVPANIEPSPECQPGNQINKYQRSVRFIKYHVNKHPRPS